MKLSLKAAALLVLFCSLQILPAKTPRVIKTGVNSNFPPYEYVDAKGNLTGSDIDILKAISKDSRLKFKFSPTDNHTLMTEFDNEDVFLLAGIVKTPELEKKYLFTRPHTLLYYSVFVRRNTVSISDWQDLNGKSILMECASPLQEIVKQKAPRARILDISDSGMAMERLANGIADCVILPKIQGFYFISERSLENLMESCTLGYPFPYCFAVPVGYGELQRKLNYELFKLQKNYGLKKIQNKWFGIYNSDVPSLVMRANQYHQLLGVVIVAFAILTFVLFMSINRLRQQRKYLDLQVAERNNYEREYFQRHQLFVSGPIVFLKWNDYRRDMFESISDNFSMFGYHPQDLLSGRIKFSNIIHPDDMERVAQERQQNHLKGQNNFFQIYRIICPPLPGRDEGLEVVNTWHYRNSALAGTNLVHIRWIFDYTVAVPMESNSTFQYYGYMLEISAQKRIENELLKQHQAAQVAINTKDIFLTGISIEINSPLNALIGLTRKLADFELSEDQKAAMQIISKSALHLKQILQQIHDFLAILKGSIGSVPQWYIVRRLMEPVIAEFQIKIASKRLAFEYNEYQPAALVFLDADWIQKIVRIIMDNAVKFTSEGKISLTVDLSRPRHGKDELVITISDTGVGIPPDKLQIIMEPFTQVDETFTRKYGGIGLGLSIARNLLVQMNGEISIESVPEQGTTVRLQIPVMTRT